VARSSLPIPPPLEGNDELIAAVITGGWVIALIVLLVERSQLAPSDRWWVWVAVAGCCIGAFGLGYVPLLKRSRQRAAGRQTAHASDSI
jgi:hypothetical protein